jgi:hypothetical protein
VEMPWYTGFRSDCPGIRSRVYSRGWKLFNKLNNPPHLLHFGNSCAVFKTPDVLRGEIWWTSMGRQVWAHCFRPHPSQLMPSSNNETQTKTEPHHTLSGLKWSRQALPQSRMHQVSSRQSVPTEASRGKATRGVARPEEEWHRVFSQDTVIYVIP